MASGIPFSFTENRLKKMAAGIFKANFSADRTPQGISQARVEGFNPENVRKFFEMCEP
jgi:hypothetical protein